MVADRDAPAVANDSLPVALITSFTNRGFADIASTKLAFEPLSGAELQTLVTAATEVSETVLQRARAARDQ